MLQEAAQKHGERPAVSFDQKQYLTYRELDRRSNQAARYLMDQGVRPGDRIGLCMEKSASFYILVLAALKIGAPYFALDPGNPSERLQAMIRQCAPQLLFTGPNESAPADLSSIRPCPRWAEIPGFCDGQSADPVEQNGLSGSDPAYLMFTSGSTGTPKGAVMSRDNLAHFMDWAGREYAFTPDDIHTHLNPVYFDNTVFDLYSTLFTGGALVPFTRDMLIDPGALGARVREMRCTIWFSVPSLLLFAQVMKIATPEWLGGLRKIIFGGEGYPKVKLKALMEAMGSHVDFHNVSGPTECTCICSNYRVTASDFADMDGFPPLGSLIPTFRGYILDGDREVAPGQTGELCLAGPCVGLGYYNQPEATSRAFVPNPVNGTGGLMYRTGDLVMLNPADGKLYFVGRKDLQIKHMGYRIELEEIQHALGHCANVDESAVVYRRDQDMGEIVAIIATRNPPDPGALRSELARHIPRYMMPARIHFLERLPKNANGKTDRQALIAKYAI